MSKKLVCLLILGLAITAQGAALPIVTWTGMIDNLWEQPFNWNTGAVPTVGDQADVVNGATAVINALITAPTGQINVGVGNPVANDGQGLDPLSTLTVYGTLTTNVLYVTVGREINDNGLLVIDGGTVDLQSGAGATGRSGVGVMNVINGGQYLCQQLSIAARQGIGIVHVNSGGVVDCTQLKNDVAGKLLMPGYWGTGGGYVGHAELYIEQDGTVLANIYEYNTTLGSFIEISGNGKLVLTGDQKILARQAIAANAIIGNGGVVEAELIEGNTVVHIIPEPMTIALLGLGGLFIRRKR